jgi:hypothetical protein
MLKQFQHSKILSRFIFHVTAGKELRKQATEIKAKYNSKATCFMNLK